VRAQIISVTTTSQKNQTIRRRRWNIKTRLKQYVDLQDEIKDLELRIKKTECKEKRSTI